MKYITRFKYKILNIIKPIYKIKYYHFLLEYTNNNGYYKFNNYRWDRYEKQVNNCRNSKGGDDL